MVVVTGASGSGKSSLLRAGLLPILARGQQVLGSDRWPRIVMTPTKDPLTELAARLAAVGGPDALAVRNGLARHPDQAHLAIRSTVLAAAARRDQQPPTSGDSGPRLVLTGTQRDFLQASERAAVRSSHRRRSAFVVLALVSVLAVAAAGFALSQRTAALRQRDQAIYNQVIADALQVGASDTPLAAQLNLAAYPIQSTPDAASRLLNTEDAPLSSPVAVGTGYIPAPTQLRWRSATMGTRWPAATATALSGCGTSTVPHAPPHIEPDA